MENVLMKEMVELLRQQSAEISALRSVVGSLVATHQDREALQRKFLDAMDVMADSTHADRIDLYRGSHQLWLQMISQPANR